MGEPLENERMNVLAVYGDVYMEIGPQTGMKPAGELLHA